MSIMPGSGVICGRLSRDILPVISNHHHVSRTWALVKRLVTAAKHGKLKATIDNMLNNRSYFQRLECLPPSEVFAFKTDEAPSFPFTSHSGSMHAGTSDYYMPRHPVTSFDNKASERSGKKFQS